MEHPEILVEIGAVLLGLAVLSRIATAMAIPTIPLFLLAGLAFGEGGLLPLVTSERFISVGAEIGLVLLLLMLGLEYSAGELLHTVRARRRTGLVDLALNLTPGIVAGLLLGLEPAATVALGGVTYVTSSGIGARLLSQPGVTPPVATTVVSVLVIEDLVMALYLPVIGVLATGESGPLTWLSAAGGVAAVIGLLAMASRLEVGISRLVFSRSDEALLLTILGVALFFAGLAEVVGISAAVMALILGIILSGPAAQAARSLLRPLRDLFAAMFFAFVGLTVDPASIPPVLLIATVLALGGVVTKFATGWWGANDCGRDERLRVGARLVARGEFSLAIAGIVAATDGVGRFEAIAVSYVLILAIAGPLITAIVDRFLDGDRARRAAEPS